MLLIWWPLIFPVAVLFGNLIGKPGWIEQPPEEQDSAALATTDQIDERPVRAKGGVEGIFPRIAAAGIGNPVMAAACPATIKADPRRQLELTPDRVVLRGGRGALRHGV